MATTEDYIQYVCDQISFPGNIRYRKMFGEYMVYVNDKPVLLVCDNTVFVKKHPAVTDLMTHADTGHPYDGAKEHFVLDMDDTALVSKIIPILEQHTEVPKKKKKASKA